MNRTSIGTNRPQDQVSSPAPAATQWKKTLFSGGSNSEKKLAESLGKTRSQMRDPNIKATVQRAAPSVLNISINNQSQAKTRLQTKAEMEPANNFRVAYKYFFQNHFALKEIEKPNLKNVLDPEASQALLNKQLQGGNYEMTVSHLDTLQSKLLNTGKLSTAELKYMKDTTQQLKTLLGKQFGKQDNPKFTATTIASAYNHCDSILKAVQNFPKERISGHTVNQPSDSTKKIPGDIEEKNITQPASSSTTKSDTVLSEVNNQNLLKEFEIDLRKELNGSHKFQWDPEAIVAIARSTLIRFQSSANFTVANLRLEFNKNIKSTSEYEPEKNLTDFEIMDLGMMMTRSFLNAQIRENSGKTVSTNSNPTQ